MWVFRWERGRRRGRFIILWRTFGYRIKNGGRKKKERAGLGMRQQETQERRGVFGFLEVVSLRRKRKMTNGRSGWPLLNMALNKPRAYKEPAQERERDKRSQLLKSQILDQIDHQGPLPISLPPSVLQSPPLPSFFIDSVSLFISCIFFFNFCKDCNCLYPPPLSLPLQVSLIALTRILQTFIFHEQDALFSSSKVKYPVCSPEAASMHALERMDAMAIPGHLTIPPFHHCIPLICAIRERLFRGTHNKDKKGGV